MAKHTAYDLKQLQSLPLEQKILMTQNRIREWYDHWQGDVYVSFSGGKDSTVLKHIVDSMYDDVPSVFVDTGLEYPEIVRFVKSIKEGKVEGFNCDVEIVRPEMSFYDVLRIHGYPVISKEVSNTVRGARNSIRKGEYSLRLRQLGVSRDEYGGLLDDGTHDYEKTVERSKFQQNRWRFLIDTDFSISERCCDVMKKKPARLYERRTGRRPIIATMASESLTRDAAWKRRGCNSFEGYHISSNPMSFWTQQDILQYIVNYRIPICSVYGGIVETDGARLKTTGCDRTGCQFCMFGITRESTPNRFQRLQTEDPKRYTYCIGGGEYRDGKWVPNGCRSDFFRARRRFFAALDESLEPKGQRMTV